MLADSSSVMSYFAVLGMVAIALIICGARILINKLLGAKAKDLNPKKDETYECGVDLVGTGHQQFSVRYYLVALIFLLFDVEVVFMYPWAIVNQTYLKVSPFIIYEVVLFALILLGGYLYLRLRGAFDWD